MSHGPGRMQLALLDALFQSKPSWTLSQSALRQAIGCDRPTIARALKRLAAHGLIERGDAPERMVTLTRPGLRCRNRRSARLALRLGLPEVLVILAIAIVVVVIVRRRL